MTATGVIPALDFAVDGARCVTHAAAPTVGFDLEVTAPPELRVHSVLLDVQVQIAARRRGYGPEAQERLGDLFGTPDRWGSTLRTLLWTRTTLVVPAFTGTTRAMLPVACTYDLEVSAARYLHGLDGGDVPLEFLFSGTVFAAGPDGRLQATRLSWEHEAAFHMPVAVWRETMNRYFPGMAWLRLRRDAFARLSLYRTRAGHPSWEAALDALLEGEA
jgi:Family of unknown function (DUF6084)